MTGLRRKFRQADGSADSILADPYTRLRIALKSLMPAEGAPEFTSALFEEFTHALARSTADQSYLDRELPAVVAAIAKGQPPETPNISRPETQLLWAAALIYIIRNHEKIKSGWTAEYAGAPLLQSELWRSLTSAPYATEEMINHHFYLSEAMRNPKVKMRWGAPGSWFYFSPEENLINADFLLSLLGGFEHTRSILFHEIGHSQLTVKFLPSMDRIQEQIGALQDKKQAQGGRLSGEDYLEMRMLTAEWKLRMQLIDKTENAVVNRYAANMGKVLAQDYGYSLNHTATTLSGYGAAIMGYDAARKDGGGQGAPGPEQAAAQAERRLTTIMNAINMVFFKNNAYFPNTRAGWLRLGIDPDLIRRDRHEANDNAQPEGEFSADFKLFLELCGGQDGLEHLQPSAKDRIYGREYYNSLTDSCADRRNAIAERIWDEFIEPFMPELRNEIKEQIQKQMEQKQQQQKQQKGKQQDGQGQEDEGQGESQEQGGQSQESQNQGGKSGSKGQKGRKSDEAQDQSGDSAEPGQGQGGDDPAGSENDSSGGDSGQDRDGKGTSSGRGKLAEDLAREGVSEDKHVDVENVGSMPDVETPPKAPGPDKGADAKAGQGKDAAKGGKDKGGEESDAKSLEELMEDLARSKKEAAEKAKPAEEKKNGNADDAGAGKGQGADAGTGGKGDKVMEGAEGDSPSQQAGGGGKEIKIEELAARDWSDYAGLVDEIAPLIGQVARMMEKIRDRQIQKMNVRSRHLEQLPQDNDVGRLDRAAHRDLIVKQRTGQDIGDNDLNRFRRDETVDRPITPDFVFMIDGSMSMNFPIAGKKATHMHVALLSAIVLYEAAKKIDANVYISLWGNATPLLLAQPGDEKAKIGENLARAIRGLNSGTDLAPSFREVIRSIVENKEKTQSYAGYTHFMVLSDGDINDRQKSEEVIERLFQASKYVTLDFGVIKRKGGDPHSLYAQISSKSDMEKVAENIQAKLPHQKVGSIVDNDPDKLTLGIVGLLIEKLLACNSFTAVPQGRKQSAFRRTLMSLDAK